MAAQLLKIILQPVFVDVTDDGAVEIPAQPFTVQGRDWADYRAPGGGLDQALATTLAQIEEASGRGDSSTDPMPSLDGATPAPAPRSS